MKSVLNHIVQKQYFGEYENNGFHVSISIPAGEDFDCVVRDIVEQFRNIADKLKALPVSQEISG